MFKKHIIGKCSFCRTAIFRNEKFKELETPLRDIKGNYITWIVHQKCFEQSIALIFKLIKNELREFDRIIHYLTKGE